MTNRVSLLPCACWMKISENRMENVNKALNSRNMRVILAVLGGNLTLKKVE